MQTGSRAMQPISNVNMPATVNTPVRRLHRIDAKFQYVKCYM